MAKITVACAAISKKIYAGKVNKAGTEFLDGKQDVTSDVLKAVIEKVGPGNIITVEVDGVPVWEIQVKRVGGAEDSQAVGSPRSAESPPTDQQGNGGNVRATLAARPLPA